MKRSLIMLMGVGTTISAFAEADGFDRAPVGAAPPGWTCGVTGRGAPTWTVESDPAAASKPSVLKQSGSGTFPWCAKTAASITNGYVEVKFKPLEGREDQAGGLMWRWKDGDNYYVARANALENNVSLYYTADGRRNTIQYVDAPVALGQWHVLRVEFSGATIKVFLDGKQYIDLDDTHLSGAGAVGVWTKADSVTEFDDFTFAAQ
ncbi:MAG TPA: hypothetical protein VIM81_20725 [Gammaproteobacteria bacterium]